MDIGTGVELECSYGAGDGRTRSGVASMPKERSGGPRLDQSCNWEKYGYDKSIGSLPPPRNGCTVQMMDRLTAQELEGSIVHKLCSNGGPKFTLGFLIDVIFATCRQQSMPNVSELTVPLKTICVWDSCL